MQFIINPDKGIIYITTRSLNIPFYVQTCKSAKHALTYVTPTAQRKPSFMLTYYAMLEITE